MGDRDVNVKVAVRCRPLSQRGELTVIATAIFALNNLFLLNVYLQN